MWIKSESTIRPLPLDKTSSPTTVYIRRGIKEIPAAEETPVHFEYEENAVPRKEWDLYESLILGDIKDLQDAVLELAEIIGG